MNRYATQLAIAFLGAVSVLGSGCGSTKCDEAVEHARSCGVTANLTADGEECNATGECQADCFLQASCLEIAGASTGQQNALTACVFACK
jgi:hypothetical protein